MVRVRVIQGNYNYSLAMYRTSREQNSDWTFTVAAISGEDQKERDVTVCSKEKQEDGSPSAIISGRSKEGRRPLLQNRNMHRPFLCRPLFLCVPVVFLLVPPLASSVPDSEALLKLKQSFIDARPLDNWAPNVPPCDKRTPWKGLICSGPVVSGLRLETMGLSGKIDIDAMAGINGLRTLSFINNSFTGNIPEFNRLGALRAIYLSGNQFSGEISDDYFAKMQSLKKVSLSDNKFTGKIPSSLGNLPNLMELNLQNNAFSGTIPPFDRVKSLVRVNLSNNKLEGEIPPTLSKFDADSFKGNPGLCGAKVGMRCAAAPAPPETPKTTEKTSEKEDSTKMYTAIAGFGLLLLFVLVVVLRSKRNQDGTVEAKPIEEPTPREAVAVDVSGSSKKGGDLSGKASSSSRKGSSQGRVSGVVGDLVVVNDEKGTFGMADLMKAAAEVLGNGTLGSAYKAAMANGISVVVKRVKEMNAVGKETFEEEIKRLGNLKHPNILTLLAFHYRKDEKLLISEHIPKGSLCHQLHDDKGSSKKLGWPERLKIMKGIAKGLGYLHQQLASSHDVPHGNLKSSNVLLGPENRPLLMDYAFCSLLNASSRQLLVANRAPEALQHNKLSPKTDVYCLGVMIFEILTLKFPSMYNSSGEGGTDLVQLVQSSISEGKHLELLDPQIASESKSVGRMEELLLLGAACTENNPETRIDVAEAVRRIEDIQVEGRRKHHSSVTEYGSFQDFEDG